MVVKIPKLTWRGRASYLASPAAFGLTLGGLSAIPSSQGEGKGYWRKLKPTYTGKDKQGKPIKGKTWVDTGNIHSRKDRFVTGAAVGAGIGGVASANRYLRNRAILKGMLRDRVLHLEDLKNSWRKMRRDAQQEFRRTPAPDAPFLSEEQRKKIRKAYNEDLANTNRGTWRERAREYQEEGAELRPDGATMMAFRAGRNIYAPYDRLNYRFDVWRRNPGTRTSSALREVALKREEALAAELKQTYSNTAFYRAARDARQRPNRRATHYVLDKHDWRQWANKLKEEEDYLRSRTKYYHENPAAGNGRTGGGGFNYDDFWREFRGGGRRTGGGGGGRAAPRARPVNLGTHLDVLGIDRDKVKTKREVKKAYRDFMRKNHPDMPGNAGGDPKAPVKGNAAWKAIKESDWFDKLAWLKKHGFSPGPAKSLAMALGPGVVAGYGAGRAAAEHTAHSITPKGRKTKAKDIAKRLATATAITGGLAGALHGRTPKGRGQVDRLARMLGIRTGTEVEREKALRLVAPLLWGAGGGVAAGVGTGALVGGGYRLTKRSSELGSTKRYGHIDFKPPAGVAAEAEKGLEYRRQSGRGGLSSQEAGKAGIGSGVQRAVNLKNRNNIAPDTIQQMLNFFSRHEKNKAISPENRGTPEKDAGHVAWLLWGGDAGLAWAKKIKKQMEAAD